MKNTKKINNSRGVVVLLIALCAPGWAIASGCSESSKTDQAQVFEPAPSLRVFVDPQTGEFIDGPAPGTAPIPAPPKSQAPDLPIQQHVRPDGSVVADIGDRFMIELRAEVVDGKLITCHGKAGDPGTTDLQVSGDKGSSNDG